MTPPATPFRKVLVANRGEIACRIMRTCRKLGISTVAICSEADIDSLHAQSADELVVVGGPRAADSYLNIDAVIAAAASTGAEAIHPGYGFLSENADFAEACVKAGIRFVGPSVEALRAMSYKGAARQIAKLCGVPILPGYDGAEQDDAVLAAEADRVGFPLLIKAVAGGGGKGMRRVDAQAQFAKNLAAVRREAASAFGDDRVLLERFVVDPRHVEVQILADGRGTTLHLFERDCSIQRRHQKVIEETPAPGMTEAVRQAMVGAAVRLAGHVGYQGAGTVEFVVDVSDGLRADGFFFLEMNTRLQVEHPVTEMVTGLDIVEWQLRIAAGEALPFAQADIACRGHSIEARLCAEDPSRMFLPSPGTLDHLDLGPSDSDVRIETGMRTGDTVTPYYDSLLAKIVVRGRDRAAAIDALAERLSQARVGGVKSNLGLLQGIVAHPAFGAGEVDTTFIERHAATLLGPSA